MLVITRAVSPERRLMKQQRVSKSEGLLLSFRWSTFGDSVQGCVANCSAPTGLATNEGGNLRHIFGDLKNLSRMQTMISITA